eukprot:tig00021435_g21388.t1
MAPFGSLRGLRKFGPVDEHGGFLVKDPGPANAFQPDRYISTMEHAQKAQEWSRLPPAQRPMTRQFRLSMLALAAYRGQTGQVLEMLTTEGGRASVNSTDSLMRTPLCYALDRGDAEMSQALLDAGASADVRLTGFDENATALTVAIDSGNADCVRLVVDRYLSGGGAVQETLFDDPAARAKRLGYVEAAGVLLAAGKIAVVLAHGGPRGAPPPDPRAPARGARAGRGDVDGEGNTSLHLACGARLPRTAEALAGMEGDFAHANREGDTALHAAVAARFLPVCLACIRKGADLLAQNSAGKTPLDCTSDVRFRHELKAQAKVRDVFISYGHQPPEVAAFARELKARLEAAHVTCWMDEMKPTGIEAGTEWREQIGAGINSAAAVVFIASKHSCKSEWCRREVARASDLGRPIFPVWREKTDLDEELKGYLFKTQFADFSTDALFEAGFPAFSHTVAQAGEGAAPAPHVALWAAPREAALARSLHAALADRGVRCFVESPAAPPSGPADAANATRAIARAGALIVLLSEESAEDPQLRDRLAELNGRPVLPVLASGLRVPAALQYSLAKSHLHAFAGDLAFGRNVDHLLSSVAAAGAALPRPSASSGAHGLQPARASPPPRAARDPAYPPRPAQASPPRPARALASAPAANAAPRPVAPAWSPATQAAIPPAHYSPVAATYGRPQLQPAPLHGSAGVSPHATYKHFQMPAGHGDMYNVDGSGDEEGRGCIVM